MLASYSLPTYIVDVLMPDLVGHDRHLYACKVSRARWVLHSAAMARQDSLQGRALAAMACILYLATLVAAARAPASYDDLLTLFADWRAFQKPRRVNGVPDYSAAGMAAQHQGLGVYRERL